MHRPIVSRRRLPNVIWSESRTDILYAASVYLDACVRIISLIIPKVEASSDQSPFMVQTESPEYYS